ncbi:P-loop containing nucleoside triphosphate hydrolase protein [Podospora australis]|uniref:P-loop containing nucleoside triphosphate hydrolase protein n=1 Tax=Podospora australis TaxID=1536484 RepID=A0AAN6WQA1_9PEZI|nr:P-loop containing nucleoside triphosphate hydrolase protein [Podospora australis]
MTDILRVLPSFPVEKYARLISVVEAQGLTTTDLLTLNAAEVGKRTQLPLLDIKRLSAAILDALHADLGVALPKQPQPPQQPPQPSSNDSPLRNTLPSLTPKCSKISTLDPLLDSVLGGGIPAGYLTEITGESGSGKTQMLLTLLLAVQLPPPYGLGRPALYVSTEAALSTRRLSQILSTNPLFSRLSPSDRPSLDKITTSVTPDLESQEHILTFQVPVAIEREGIGLLVIDSIAANYRAEFERSASTGSNMGARTAELVKMGMHLRDLARRHNLAVVVSNQVADRFSSSGSGAKTPASSLRPLAVYPGQQQQQQQQQQLTQESPLATRSRSFPTADRAPSSSPTPSSIQPPIDGPPEFIPPQQEEDEAELAEITRDNIPPALLLDHQQKWFTGWGDNLPLDLPLKTPSLGLVWSTQIAGRIALFRRPAHHNYSYQQHTARERELGLAGSTKGWKRWMKVVWGVNAPGTGTTSTRQKGKKKKQKAIEFEVYMGGIRAVGTSASNEEKGEKDEDEGEEDL